MNDAKIYGKADKNHNDSKKDNGDTFESFLDSFHEVVILGNLYTC